ncbi:hypothetical protein G6F46_010791 [Rhizopus delemar]|uniref:Uncharacterized protein n=2 Tax=Rhizopus TaxID=4842 RepID=A0A9P7CIU1_9FUNG|nr:hypothetical protein G6F36_011324 [Rhizopus arrhizus]KAG1449285.1 hypothetical protein G6F55_010236 [Rhizopus delemar]KAG1489919.1 hypothetical protein G6F54_011098 [Rhizopus delemar]KAG1503347.1 hypothetical protein G6F52_012288 [Rhizopus delemar]KAG1503473.1 hypothetical protein G6F53_010619 [Rhizopus delemar]
MLYSQTLDTTDTVVFWTSGTVVVTLRNDLIDLLKFKRSIPSTYKRKTNIGIDEQLTKKISVVDTNNMSVDGLEQALCSFLKSHIIILMQNKQLVDLKSWHRNTLQNMLVLTDANPNNQLSLFNKQQQQ